MKEKEESTALDLVQEATRSKRWSHTDDKFPKLSSNNLQFLSFQAAQTIVCKQSHHNFLTFLLIGTAFQLEIRSHEDGGATQFKNQAEQLSLKSPSKRAMDEEMIIWSRIKGTEEADVGAEGGEWVKGLESILS